MHLELYSALDHSAQPRLQRLHDDLERFYDEQLPEEYFPTADATNVDWLAATPAHAHLFEQIKAGASVLDIGCGSAPAVSVLERRAGTYVGIDWSPRQIEMNRERWPQHEFLAQSVYAADADGRQFDVVFSSYVIEHLVWPHRFLRRLHGLTAPGGLMAILTPPFRHREYLKSFPYGLSAQPFAQKVRRLRWIDAGLHLYQHRVVYPRILRRDFPRGYGRGHFLIHANPVCLSASAWFPDADAVYLSDTAEIASYLEILGAALITHWPRLGYVLMRKTEAPV